MADTAIRLIHEAIDRSDDGDYEVAITLLTRAIEVDPMNPQAYHERAMALLNMDREGEALVDFNRALELDPKFPGARAWRARTLSALGEHRASAEDRLYNLRECPDGPHEGMGVCPQDWADCAEEFVKAGDPAKAIALLEEYLLQYASRVTAYACYETAPLRVLARLFADSGELEQARELARRACASPHKVPADVQLAERLHRP
jgi:Tfp pilus assembly protein PilF